jgi:hypothetical protein
MQACNIFNVDLLVSIKESASYVFVGLPARMSRFGRCCFDPRTRLMLPPMASSSMSAASVIFCRYRPMPLSSYNATLSAVDTDRCCLRRAAVAFAVPLPLPAVVVRRCHRRKTLPLSYDAAIVVRRCRCRTTLPSSYNAAVVVQRYYRMPSSAAVVGCCGQGCLWRRCFARELHRKKGTRRCTGVSGCLNIATPIQRLRPPVLRHQAEAQITICAKPGAQEAHMGRTGAYAWRTPGAKKN